MGAFPDYPDTASFLTTLFGVYIPEEWLPDPVRAAMAKLREAPAATREHMAASLLAGVVQKDVPAAGIGYSVSAAFLSPRVGCRVFPPFSAGPDLAALCPAGNRSPTPAG